MDRSLREKILKCSREVILDEDPAHDFAHALRVTALAERIANDEGADLDVVIPAALFHDAVNPPKDDPRAKHASDDSAELAERVLLREVDEFPKDKLVLVKQCIRECSFNKGIIPDLLESRVLQDADRLEATGAIAIMRTFASTGRMSRPFYNANDSFCEHREPEPKHYAVDLFYVRLLKIEKLAHTRIAKELARQRTEFLLAFLTQLAQEIS